MLAALICCAGAPTSSAVRARPCSTGIPATSAIRGASSTPPRWRPTIPFLRLQFPDGPQTQRMGSIDVVILVSHVQVFKDLDERATRYALGVMHRQALECRLVETALWQVR